MLRATKLGLLATALGSSAFAMTLMACYGCPDCAADDFDKADANADASTRDANATCTADTRYACYQCCIPLHPGDTFAQDRCAEACEPKEDSGPKAPKDAGTDADAAP